MNTKIIKNPVSLQNSYKTIVSILTTKVVCAACDCIGVSQEETNRMLDNGCICDNCNKIISTVVELEIE